MKASDSGDDPTVFDLNYHERDLHVTMMPMHNASTFTVTCKQLMELPIHLSLPVTIRATHPRRKWAQASAQPIAVQGTEGMAAGVRSLEHS